MCTIHVQLAAFHPRVPLSAPYTQVGRSREALCLLDEGDQINPHTCGTGSCYHILLQTGWYVAKAKFLERLKTT